MKRDRVFIEKKGSGMAKAKRGSLVDSMAFMRIRDPDEEKEEKED